MDKYKDELKKRWIAALSEICNDMENDNCELNSILAFSEEFMQSVRSAFDKNYCDEYPDHITFFRWSVDKKLLFVIRRLTDIRDMCAGLKDHKSEVEITNAKEILCNTHIRIQ